MQKKTKKIWYKFSTRATESIGRGIFAFMSGGAAGGQARASPKAPADDARDTTGAAATLVQGKTALHQAQIDGVASTGHCQYGVAQRSALVKDEDRSSDEEIQVAELYVQPGNNARKHRVCMGSSVLVLKPGVDRAMIQECARIVINANRSRHKRVLGTQLLPFPAPIHNCQWVPLRHTAPS